MKYKDLPSEKLIQKLRATAFESPTSNRQVYNWTESILKHVRFLEGERVKLVQKYGEKNSENGFTVPHEKLNDFFKEFNKILEMDIDEDIKPCPIKENWFDDMQCTYSRDKNMWISPEEIASLVSNKK